MRFEVPQFIEIENQIFGPFTWKQFVYIVGGCGALFMLYVTLPFIVFLIIGAPIAAFTAALAFYQHNNRPFIYLLESFVGYLSGTKLYLWKKSERKRIIKTPSGAPPQTYMPPASSSLASLSRKLEMNALQNKH